MAVDYTTLVAAKTTAGSIKYLVNYDRLDPETILTEAHAYIFSALRVREMRKTAAITLAVGDTTHALPEGFLDPIKLTLFDGEGDVSPVAEHELLSLRDYDVTAADGTLNEGRPLRYATFDELIQLDCAVETAVAGTVLFYSNAFQLTGAATTNFLTSRYPSMLLAAVRMYAYMHMENDGDSTKWAKLTDELISRANIENDFGRRGADYAVSVR